MAGQGDRTLEELSEAAAEGGGAKEGVEEAGSEEAGSKKQDPAYTCQEGYAETTLTTEVAAIFATIANVLASITAVLTSIKAILDAIASSAVVAEVAAVFTPIAPILTPVAPVLAPIRPVFKTISPAALRCSGEGRHRQCREDQRSQHTFAQNSHHFPPSQALSLRRGVASRGCRPKVKGQTAKVKGQV
jgi:hypothetical protein